MPTPEQMRELRDAVLAESQARGIHPSDLLTAISYETAGTFDPWKKGPTTKWGQHAGLIQWGEPQRQKYGVTPDMSITDQVKAAGRYLDDAGVKPGMGLLDIYSAINAGRVGLYDRSDAAAGGAPGTVADKVASQMFGHRAKANALLGNEFSAAAPAPSMPAPQQVAGTSGGATLPEAPAQTSGQPVSTAPLIEAMQKLQQQPEQQTVQLEPISHPEQAYIRRAKLARAALNRNQTGA